MVIHGRRRDTGQRVKVIAGWIELPPDRLLPCVSKFVGGVWADINEHVQAIELEPGTLAVRVSTENDRPVDAIEIVVLSSRADKTSIEIDALESHADLARMLWDDLYLRPGSDDGRQGRSESTQRLQHPMIRERQDRVKKLYLDGRERAEIADIEQVSVETIKGDLRALREAGEIPKV